MLALSLSHGNPRGTRLRAEGIFERHAGGIARRTDRLFAGLLAFQWVTAVATAPDLDGEVSRVHVPVQTHP